MKIVVLGLSLSSSWGNGHATTYRALLSAFAARGHDVTFLERDVSWYAASRDLPDPRYCKLRYYSSLEELAAWRPEIASADALIVGSYVPEGKAVIKLVQDWAAGVTAFYDIDTPVTLATLKAGTCDYLDAAQIAQLDLYLSFTGGPTLQHLAAHYGSPMARALFCSVDTSRYAPVSVPVRWDLSYLGTYSADRQPSLERLLIEPARTMPERRFVVAGPLYPADIQWPENVERIEHLPPEAHPAFYSASRYTLNLTRADMRAAGWSPSVRLFEAGACATPILSDIWGGLDEIFEPGREIVLVQETTDVTGILPRDGSALGDAARRRILRDHDAICRAATLEGYFLDAIRSRVSCEHRQAGKDAA